MIIRNHCLFLKVIVLVFLSLNYNVVKAAPTCDGDLSFYTQICIQLSNGQGGIKNCGYGSGGEMIITCVNGSEIVVRNRKYDNGFHEAVEDLKTREETYE